MNDEAIRLQCLQHASSLLGMYNMPGQEPKHSPEEVLTLANKLFQFCKSGSMPA